MIDTLVQMLPRTDTSAVLRRLGLPPGARYVLVTLHRPSTVDEDCVLEGVLGALARLAARTSVVFPIHPRSYARLDVDRWSAPGLTLTKPLSYLDFLSLQQRAAVVVTDSGGVQEETTWLGVPCLTVRDNTERPVTVKTGTNTVIGRDPDRLYQAVRAVLDGGGRRGKRPELWDGRAAERIACVLVGESERRQTLHNQQYLSSALRPDPTADEPSVPPVDSRATRGAIPDVARTISHLRMLPGCLKQDRTARPASRLLYMATNKGSTRRCHSGILKIRRKEEV